MKKFRKKVLMRFEIIWFIICGFFLVSTGIDYFFDTQIISSIKSHEILSTVFDLDEEEQWTPVDLEDPYFVQIQNNIEQVMPAESVQSIKVKQNSEFQKTFLISSKDWDEQTVLVSFSGGNYILEHLIRR